MLLFRAQGAEQRTSGAEDATAGWVCRGRQISPEADLLLLAGCPGIRQRHGGQESLRVGMPGIPEQFLPGSLFHDLAERSMIRLMQRLNKAILLRRIRNHAVARSDRASAVSLFGAVLGDGLAAVASTVDCSWVNGGARFMIQGVISGLFVYQK
ncbi:hypothetical protein GCM10023346_43700 [Arthrobacter gyeryongensis]|uniref:Uncharacterized protein n=1 Tax=Arthrobacter gyeryongensis TaxID=1650592 RepID=A0ABP9SUA1_9MICC